MKKILVACILSVGFFHLRIDGMQGISSLANATLTANETIEEFVQDVALDLVEESLLNNITPPSTPRKNSQRESETETDHEELQLESNEDILDQHERQLDEQSERELLQHIEQFSKSNIAQLLLETNNQEILSVYCKKSPINELLHACTQDYSFLERLDVQQRLQKASMEELKEFLLDDTNRPHVGAIINKLSPEKFNDVISGCKDLQCMDEVLERFLSQSTHEIRSFLRRPENVKYLAVYLQMPAARKALTEKLDDTSKSLVDDFFTDELQESLVQEPVIDHEQVKQDSTLETTQNSTAKTDTAVPLLNLRKLDSEPLTIESDTSRSPDQVNVPTNLRDL